MDTKTKEIVELDETTSKEVNRRYMDALRNKGSLEDLEYVPVKAAEADVLRTMTKAERARWLFAKMKRLRKQRRKIQETAKRRKDVIARKKRHKAQRQARAKTQRVNRR